MVKQGWFNLRQRQELQEWLERPNGAFHMEDSAHKCEAVFEAVEGGGITVKMWPPS